MSYTEAIFDEIFLSMYDKWRQGIYTGSDGKLNVIKQMNTVYLKNAITSMTTKREDRKKKIMALPEVEQAIAEIKSNWIADMELMALKIAELQEELDSRNKETVDNE